MFLKISVLVVAASVLVYYNKNLRDIFGFLKNDRSAENLYTAEQLSKFNGIDSEFLYLSIMGHVYDVTSGRRHYEPGSHYNIFIGRDASKSFVTGEFEDTSKELDDVLTLSHDDLNALNTWMKMYDEQYTYKGKLIGRFYYKDGSETEYLLKVKNKLLEAKQENKLKEELRKEYPPCNIEWVPEKGSRVWCSKRSGGVSRDWEGAPRLLYNLESKETQCVCLNLNDESLGKNVYLLEYNNCEPTSTFCYAALTESAPSQNKVDETLT